MLVRPLHRLEFLVDVELLASLEHQHLHASRREDVRRHAAGGPGSDHDRIVGAPKVDLGLDLRLETGEQTHRLTFSEPPDVQ